MLYMSVLYIYVFVLLGGPQKQATVPFGAQVSVLIYTTRTTVPQCHLSIPLSLPLGHAPTPPTGTVLTTLRLLLASLCFAPRRLL